MLIQPSHAVKCKKKYSAFADFIVCTNILLCGFKTGWMFLLSGFSKRNKIA